MEAVMQKVGFEAYGYAITDIVRDLFWNKGRPLEKLLEILLGCMSGTNQSEEDRLRYGCDVLLGRSKFDGFTGDGTYGLADDDYTLVFDKIAELRTENSKLRKYLEDIGADPDEILEDTQPEPFSGLLENFLEARRHDDNYGWLSPAGAFTPVDFADHAQWAMDYVLEHGWLKQVAEAEVSDAKDFLILKKGWVLLHNPQQGTAIVTSAPDRRLTKAQREFLYDYYVKRSRMDLAEAYLKEEIS